MFNQNSGYSLADIAAATGSGRSGGDGMWDNGSWWIIVLFLFCFMGWGNNGLWGGAGGYGGGAAGGAIPYVVSSAALTEADLQRGFDNQTVINKLNGLENGLCDGFYAMNTGLLNGFNTVNANVAAGFSGVNNAVCTLGYQNAQLINGAQNAITTGITGIGTQLAQCCCDNRAAIQDVKYQMATDTCALGTNIANATRDIIDNDNANYRALSDRLTAMEMSAKDDRIAALTADNQSLKFAASQQAQNAYLVSQLSPAPIPAYTVPNPYTGYTYNRCGCGCGCSTASLC